MYKDPELKKEYHRHYREAHRDEIRAKALEYRKTKGYDAEYYQKNKKRIRAYQKKYWEEHKGALLAQQREYFHAHRERQNELRKQRYHAHKHLERHQRVEWHLKKKYGITREQYHEMFVAQDGVCAICSQPSDKALCVDHDHATNVIRGLLCTRCNFAVGYHQDSPELVRKLESYLLTHSQLRLVIGGK